MKKFLFPLLTLLVLTSCSSKPELREDIKQFISQFSLETAMNEYKSGGYTSTTVDTTEGKEVKTVITLEYSRVDENHPTYEMVTTVSENDVVTSNVEVRFAEIDDEYYLITNDESEKSSLKEVNGLITKFFYETEPVEGYHERGQYYGDLLKETSYKYQSFITIDQENELYILKGTVKVSGVTQRQNYSVNKFGMLVENHSVTENDVRSVVQDIYVHN